MSLSLTVLAATKCSYMNPTCQVGVINHPATSPPLGIQIRNIYDYFTCGLNN